MPIARIVPRTVEAMVETTASVFGNFNFLLKNKIIGLIDKAVGATK